MRAGSSPSEAARAGSTRDVDGIAGRDDAVIHRIDALDLADRIGHAQSRGGPKLAGSAAASLISIGCGTPVRSPISSPIS